MYIGNRTIAELLDWVLSGTGDNTDVPAGEVVSEYLLCHQVIQVVSELEANLEVSTRVAMSRIARLRSEEIGEYASTAFLHRSKVVAILRELSFAHYEFMQFIEFMEHAGFPDPDFLEFDIEEYSP